MRPMSMLTRRLLYWISMAAGLVLAIVPLPGWLDPFRPDLALLARRALESGGELEEESDLLTGGRALMHSVTFSPRPDGLAVVAVVVRDLRYLDEFARSMNQWLLITGALLLGVTALITALVEA